MADEKEETDWEARKRRMTRDIVLETLQTFGMTPEDVKAMQEDMAFLRRLRIANQRVNAKIMLTLVGAILTAAGALLVLGFQSIMGNQ